jgi:hypothetical protein
MPVFSLRSQRLRGEFLNRRLPENHKLPNEPRFADTPPWGAPRPTKRTQQPLEDNGSQIDRVSIFGRTYLIDFTGKSWVCSAKFAFPSPSAPGVPPTAESPAACVQRGAKDA